MASTRCIAGHVSGQFAFVTFDEREGAHPFTISSAWQDDGRLMFLIKALGNYTHRLAASLKVGDTVTVEGPYGRFQFEGAARRQIWIGGGSASASRPSLHACSSWRSSPTAA